MGVADKETVMIILAVIGVLVFWTLILLLCRKIACWYFKINKIVSLLEKIVKALEKK